MLSVRQSLRGSVSKAIFDFNMISNGDRILVGLSGGKDSLFLLAVLANIRRWGNVRFDLEAVTVDMTGGRFDASALVGLCEELGTPYHTVLHPIEDIIIDRDERSPCSLCANLRRGILNTFAARNGFKKVALGHNMDDVAETAVMNLFRNGRFKAFLPNLYQSKSDTRIIRPLVFLGEAQILEECNRLGLPVCQYLCPFGKETERSRTKRFIASIQGDFPYVKTNIINALRKIDQQEDKWEVQNISNRGKKRI